MSETWYAPATHGGYLVMCPHIVTSFPQLSGMVVMNQAVEMAITKAQEHGFGMVATKNTSSGTGAIGYFGHLIASRYF